MTTQSITIRSWQNYGMMRYYITGEQGTDLGYVQVKHVPRNSSSYGNAHRTSKGDDTYEEITNTIICPLVLAFLTKKNIDGHEYLDLMPLMKHCSGNKVAKSGRKWAYKWVEGTEIKI